MMIFSAAAVAFLLLPCKQINSMNYLALFLLIIFTLIILIFNKVF